jgi:stage V sporulation protein SpoVS
MMLTDDIKAPYKVKSIDPVLVPDQGEIWVRSGDDVHKLAADLLDMLDDFRYVDLACIGAGCLNQAIKAVAVARERLARVARDIVMQPYFSSFIDDRDRSRTRIMLRCVEVDL